MRAASSVQLRPSNKSTAGLSSALVLRVMNHRLLFVVKIRATTSSPLSLDKDSKSCAHLNCAFSDEVFPSTSKKEHQLSCIKPVRMGMTLRAKLQTFSKKKLIQFLLGTCFDEMLEVCSLQTDSEILY